MYQNSTWVEILPIAYESRIHLEGILSMTPVSRYACIPKVRYEIHLCFSNFFELQCIKCILLKQLSETAHFNQ